VNFDDWDFELSRSPLFNANVSKFHDWSRRIRIRPRDVFHCPDITQNTFQLSQALPLNDVDSLHAERNYSVAHSCSFYVPRTVRLLLHIIFHVFYFLFMYFTFLLLVLRKFVEPNRRLILKINSDVRGGFICRN
jgi:hypothetical protein